MRVERTSPKITILNFAMSDFPMTARPMYCKVSTSKSMTGNAWLLWDESGAGKSTVIELISRFYDVQEGEVLIGGKNVKELDYDTILKNVAIVFQKTFLTRDSVLENIRMGSNATLEEVRAAAKEAQIDDFIMSLPDGYDTKVGSFRLPLLRR